MPSEGIQGDELGSLRRASTYDRDERGITCADASPTGDRGPVVVAGVTPRQGGRESRPQGEGGQAVKDSGAGRYA